MCVSLDVSPLFFIRQIDRQVGEQERQRLAVAVEAQARVDAAFEYIVNLEFELRARGVRDMADITYVSNEYEMGDFGMNGVRNSKCSVKSPNPARFAIRSHAR